MTTNVKMFGEIMRLLGSGKKVALCTIIEKVGSGPRDIGAKILVSEDGETFGTIGGGNLERLLVDESLKTFRQGKPREVVFSLHKGGKEETIKTGLICGGEVTIFIDIIEPKQKLIIIGGGHVAQPLAILAETVGLSLTVLDDNADLATKKRFPMAERIVTGSFTEILDELDVTPKDFVVIVHGEPEHDYLALEKIIKKRPAYIGLLGSRTKVAMIIKRLKTTGVSDEDLEVLHAPLGLDIGAQTPEEIGISILAEIIRERRKA
jgi:xanthine dehydrogenase accessory factor